jgi:hypothetical protein
MFSIRKAYWRSVGEGIVRRWVLAMDDALRSSARRPITTVSKFADGRGRPGEGQRGTTFFDCFDEEVQCEGVDCGVSM